jgi:hypothetical protein
MRMVRDIPPSGLLEAPTFKADPGGEWRMFDAQTVKDKVVEVKSEPYRERTIPVRVVESVESRVIKALAELHAMGVTTPTRELLATMAGYSNIKSAGFAKAVAGLKEGALLTIPADGRLQLTAAGLAEAPEVTKPSSADEMRMRIVAVLGTPTDKILARLCDAYPDAIDRPTLAAAVGYSNIKSAGFATAISKLRDMNFVTANDGEVRASPTLFPGQ